MGLVWLVYEQDGLQVVVIERGYSLIAARLRASIAHGVDAYFVKGQELPDDAEIDEALVGKMLTKRQAEKVLEGL